MLELRRQCGKVQVCTGEMTTWKLKRFVRFHWRDDNCFSFLFITVWEAGCLFGGFLGMFCVFEITFTHPTSALPLTGNLIVFMLSCTSPDFENERV